MAIAVSLLGAMAEAQAPAPVPPESLVCTEPACAPGTTPDPEPIAPPQEESDTDSPSGDEQPTDTPAATEGPDPTEAPPPVHGSSDPADPPPQVIADERAPAFPRDAAVGAATPVDETSTLGDETDALTPDSSAQEAESELSWRAGWASYKARRRSRLGFTMAGVSLALGMAWAVTRTTASTDPLGYLATPTGAVGASLLLTTVLFTPVVARANSYGRRSGTHAGGVWYLKLVGWLAWAGSLALGGLTYANQATGRWTNSVPLASYVGAVALASTANIAFGANALVVGRRIRATESSAPPP
jgi:hypothetical protein